MLPIINAPFRLLLRLQPAAAVSRRCRSNWRCPIPGGGTNCPLPELFPNSGAGEYSYQEALQLYGPSYQLREPRKTFRLTVGTTF